jgi:type IV secretion system protein VirB2
MQSSRSKNAHNISSRRTGLARSAVAATLCASWSSDAAAQAAGGGGILQPVQGVLQEVVTTLTGPLGVLIGALSLIAIGVLWASGRLDIRSALSSIMGIALIGTALVVAEAVFSAAGA